MAGAIDFRAGLRYRNATPSPIVHMTAEAMKAGHATAAHPDIKLLVQQATNEHQHVGKTDPKTDRTITQPTDNPATNQALATAAMPGFVARLKRIIAPIKGAELFAARDAKNPARLAEKIVDEEQPAYTIADYGAVQISVDTPKGKDEVVTGVRRIYPLVKVKDLFDRGDHDYHFNHVSLQVKMPSHATIEVQIVPKEVMEANPDQHHAYKGAREAKIKGDTDEFERQAEVARDKNDTAMAAFTRRNENKDDGEHKYKFGNTQANLPKESDAAKAFLAAQNSIPNEHLAGDGKNIDEPHVTVKYGVKGRKTDGLRKYIQSQQPFDATLAKTTSFPPSEHSDGAAVIKADVHSPELHRMNSEIAQHGDFAASNFPDYKPHVTVAYVKPEHVAKHVGNIATEGKKFRISSVHISDRDGNKEEVHMGSGKAAGNSERKGDSGQSPEQGAGSDSTVAPASKDVAKPESPLAKGSSVIHHDGTTGTVQWTMGAKARMKTFDGGRRDVAVKDVTPIPSVEKTGGGWIGVDLDATLAKYDGYKGPTVIGEPITAMVERVKKWLGSGEDVRIFTARIANDPTGVARKAISAWVEKNIGRRLPITNVKDDKCKEIWDDRSVQVEPNTGKPLGKPAEALTESQNHHTVKVDFRPGLKPR